MRYIVRPDVVGVVSVSGVGSICLIVPEPEDGEICRCRVGESALEIAPTCTGVGKRECAAAVIGNVAGGGGAVLGVSNRHVGNSRSAAINRGPGIHRAAGRRDPGAPIVVRHQRSFGFR